MVEHCLNLKVEELVDRKKLDKNTIDQLHKGTLLTAKQYN